MEQQPREQLRSERALRPLKSEEEGTSVMKLPNGVYGFTYAPATETPLFARKAYHSFEVHKLADGRIQLLAFVSTEDAERLRRLDDDLDVTVFPDPYEDATSLVDIAFDRVASNLYKPVRYDGNAVPLKVMAR